MTDEQLNIVRERLDGGYEVSSLDAALLLAEVERLRADPLPAAAWVRECERAAYQRGAEAMREAVIRHLVDRSKKQREAGDYDMPRVLEAAVERIRALPLPKEGA